MLKITESSQQEHYGLRPVGLGGVSIDVDVHLSVQLWVVRCPYTDGNSEIRQFYGERDGDLFPVKLWREHCSGVESIMPGCAAHWWRRANASSAHGRL